MLKPPPPPLLVFRSVVKCLSPLWGQFLESSVCPGHRGVAWHHAWHVAKGCPGRGGGGRTALPTSYSLLGGLADSAFGMQIWGDQSLHGGRKRFSGTPQDDKDKGREGWAPAPPQALRLPGAVGEPLRGRCWFLPPRPSPGGSGSGVHRKTLTPSLGDWGRRPLWGIWRARLEAETMM